MKKNREYREDDPIYCPRCWQNKRATEFKIWLTDRNKALFCDRCHDDISVKVKLKKAEEERKAKIESENPPIMTGTSKLKSSQEKLRIRRTIEIRNEQRQIELDHEL